MINTPSSGEIWLVRFRFLDRPEVSKVRPTVIVSYDGERLLAVAAKVTSHAPRENVPGELILLDWRDEGLDLPSCVRCSQIIEIPRDLLFRRLGRLTEFDMARFERALREIGAIR